MFRTVVRKSVTHTFRVRQLFNPTVSLTPARGSVRGFGGEEEEEQPPFDATLLRVLVCPLSKKPLRYNAQTNELINEELGIAFPIIDGIPNMIPQDARVIHKEGDAAPQE